MTLLHSSSHCASRPGFRRTWEEPGTGPARPHPCARSGFFAAQGRGGRSLGWDRSPSSCSGWFCAPLESCPIDPNRTRFWSPGAQTAPARRLHWYFRQPDELGRRTSLWARRDLLGARAFVAVWARPRSFPVGNLRLGSAIPFWCFGLFFFWLIGGGFSRRP